jgi:hypothetical protein
MAVNSVGLIVERLAVGNGKHFHVPLQPRSPGQLAIGEAVDVLYEATPCKGLRSDLDLAFPCRLLPIAEKGR